MIPIIIKTNKELSIKTILDKIQIGEVNLENIYQIKAINKVITINQIKDLQKDLLVKTPKKRVIIFYDFDNCQLVVQNSLLKMIEEENDKAIFIFLAKNLEKIIPTILSRAKILNLINIKEQIKNNTYKKIVDLIKEINNSEKPSFLKNEEFINIDQETTIDYIDQFLIYFQKQLKEKNSLVYAQIIKECFRVRNFILNNNLNLSLAFDHLLIFFWKKLKIKKE